MSAPIIAARSILEAGLPIGPQLHPCSCTHGKHAHRGPTMAGRCNSCGCARYRPNTAYQLALATMEQAGRTVTQDLEAWHTRLFPRPKVDPGGWGVGPSDTGSCRKQIWFRELHPELGTDPVDERAALMGDLVHEIIRRARMSLYPTATTGRLYEVPVRVPGLDRPGRVDEFRQIEMLLEDYKSAGETTWERLRNGARESHREQTAIYGLGMEAAGHKVKHLRLTYLRRSTGEEAPFTWDYDPAYARWALGKLLAINTALDLGEDLPRDGRGPSKDVFCRNHCEFVSACWSVQQAAEFKVSPEMLTILGRSPEVAEIAHAAALVRGWKEQENVAHEEFEAAKSILVGVPEGTYGEFEVRKRTREVRDDKRHLALIEETIAEYLTYPPEIRGDLVDWIRSITPPMRKESWIEVRRVHPSKRQAVAA